MPDVDHQEHVDTVLNQIERVSEEAEVGIEVEPEEIAERLEEFKSQRIEPEEGVRYVTRDILREAGVSKPSDYLSGQSVGGAAGPAEHVPISEVDSPNNWITVEGTVIEIYEPKADGMVQNGIIADETGNIRFTAWKNNGSDPVEQTLEEGESYRLSTVVTDEFEQAQQIELKLRGVTEVTKLTGEDALGIDPKTYTEEFEGAIVDFQEPMGLVDRCPNTDCGRVVSSHDECPDCGDIEAELDVRTKAVVDNGQETHTIILEKELTAELAVSLEDAKEYANEHNNREVVTEFIEAELHGEYLNISGRDYGQTFSVEGVELIQPPSIHAFDEIEAELKKLP